MSNQCLDHLLLLIYKRPVHQRFRPIHPSLHSSIHLYQPSINPYVRRPCTHTLIHPSTTIHPPIYNSTSIHPNQPSIHPSKHLHLSTHPTNHTFIYLSSIHAFIQPSIYRHMYFRSSIEFIQICIHSVIYESIHPPSHLFIYTSIRIQPPIHLSIHRKVIIIGIIFNNHIALNQLIKIIKKTRFPKIHVFITIFCV